MVSMMMVKSLLVVSTACLQVHVPYLTELSGVSSVLHGKLSCVDCITQYLPAIKMGPSPHDHDHSGRTMAQWL